MAACIVCNLQTMPGDLPDVTEMVSLCARLEKVLDEAVPVDSVVCSSCECDLAQIEMYYALLTVFKKRYSESAKQRLQSPPADTSRNLLHETANSSSYNLQSIFVTRDSSENSNSGLLLQSDVSDANVSPETYVPVVKLEIHDVRTIEDELHIDKSVPLGDLSALKEDPSTSCDAEVDDRLQVVNTSGQPYSASGEAEINQTCSDGSVEAAAWESNVDEAQTKNCEKTKASDMPSAGSSGEVTKKCGRPRKHQQPGANLSPRGMVKEGESSKIEQSNVSTLDIVAIPRKRGRPRKNAQPSPFDVSIKCVKNRGRPIKDAQLIGVQPDVPTSCGRPRKDSLIVCAKKPEQPRKYIHSSVFKHKDSKEDILTEKETSIDFEESESEEFTLGEQTTDESDVNDRSYEPKLLSATPSSKGAKGCVISKPLENKTGDSVIEGSKANTSSGATDPTRSHVTFSVGGLTTKNKRGRPRKIQDPSNVAAVIQIKRGRPKKDAGPRPAFTCTTCNRAFKGQWKLKAHMNTHLEDRPFGCSICSKTYKTVGDLNAHKKTHLTDRPFNCDICGKTFLRKKNLKAHLVVHNDVRSFQCDQCERKFKADRHLRHHVKVHHMDGRMYLCNICGLALLTEGSLRNHIKIHNEARPFTCEICGRGFSTKAIQLNHELTHKADTREKYLCPICGKALLQKSYLPLHMRQHTGESKHTCSICNKSFATSSHYKNHMTIHSGEKPHRCTECGKGFAGKGNLKTHMMSHTDERPHKCSCGQSFRSKAKMRRHMRTNKHGECVQKLVDSESLNRQVPHTTPVAASVPVAVPSLTGEPVSMPAPLPSVAPLPIEPALTIADQPEMMAAYETGL